MDQSNVVVLYKRLQESYLQVQQLKLDRKNAKVVQECLLKVKADFEKLTDLIMSLPEDDLLPQTDCRKADLFKSNVEFEAHIYEWLKHGGGPTLGTGHFVNDGKSLGSRSNSLSSTSSSIRSKKWRSKVKLQLVVLANSKKMYRAYVTRLRARKRAEKVRRETNIAVENGMKLSLICARSKESLACSA